MTAAVEHAYQNLQPSSLDAGRLHLASSRFPSEEGADPFVRARVAEPRAVAMAMRLVSDVVRSRHHIPAAMLERILIEADPVLTWGGGVLRIEGFSSCGGLYVRADVSGETLQAAESRSGTTNVDFNAGMRAALAQVRNADSLDLQVGEKGVQIDHRAASTSKTIVERRVKLPLRWLYAVLSKCRLSR